MKEAPDGAEFEALVLQHVRGCSHVPENLGHCIVEDTLFLAMSFGEGLPMGQWAQIAQVQSFTPCVRDLAPLRTCIRSQEGSITTFLLRGRRSIW